MRMSKKRDLDTASGGIPFVPLKGAKIEYALIEDGSMDDPGPTVAPVFVKRKYSRKYHKTNKRKKMPAKSKKRTTRRSYRKKPSVAYFDKRDGYYKIKPYVNSGINHLSEEFGHSWKLANPAQRMHRATAGYRGRGLYGGQGAYSFGRDIGRRLGSKVGSMLGQKHLGREIGGFAGKALGTYTGTGLYGGQGAYSNDHQMNALMEGGLSSMDVIGHNDETERITITQREYVKDIYAPNDTGFYQQKLEINPGIPTFAPKLSAIAGNYEQYEILQLIYEIVPLISESNVNNGITGTIMACHIADPSTDNIDNKEDVMQKEGSVSGRIVDRLTLGVECDTSKTKGTEYFVRTTPVPFGRDKDEFDHGQVIIATNNIPTEFANQTIAELYVYYTVELRGFKSGTVRLNNQLRDLFTIKRSAITRTLNDTPDGHFFADEVIKAQQSNLHTQLSSSGSKNWSLTFPADYNGFVEIKLCVEGTAFAVTGVDRGATFVTTGNVDQINDIYAGAPLPNDPTTNSDNPSDSIFGQSTVQIICITRLRVRAATAGINNMFEINLIAPIVSPGNVTQWSYEVMEISTNLWTSRNNFVPQFQNLNNPTFPEQA